MLNVSDPINIVTIGHIDHGKSTLIGRMLYDSGAMVGERLKDAEDAAKKLGKEKIDFAFLMDTFQEEREEGITIDIMHTPFKGKKNEYMFIDCPGHREFIKNMITGTSHADAALLLVSAKEGEGIQNQTKEHLWLAKILGIEQMIVVINKMDTVNYRKDVYDRISNQLLVLLKYMGYSAEKIPFVPISAREGDNVYKKSKNMGWYDGDSLIDVMDITIKPVEPPANLPLRIVVQDVYDIVRERVVVGRVETGVVGVGNTLVFKPSNAECTVSSIKIIEQDVDVAKAGDGVGMILNGDIDFIKRGDVASHKSGVTKVVKRFVAQIYIMQSLEMRVGDVVDIRCGTASANCKLEKIINIIDPRSGEVVNVIKNIVARGDAATVEFISEKPIAMEKHSEIQQLGRFIILHDGLTKAYGIVVDLKETI